MLIELQKGKNGEESKAVFINPAYVAAIEPHHGTDEFCWVTLGVQDGGESACWPIRGSVTAVAALLK
jgi:hypothetical protein